MKIARVVLVLVIITAGAGGMALFFRWTPALRDTLPSWLSELLPDLASPEAGWLSAGLVLVLVSATLGVGAVERTLERRERAQEVRW